MATIREIAQELIENDRTGDFCHRKITLEEATQFVGCMDNEYIPDDMTPEAFMDAWNDIIDEWEYFWARLTNHQHPFMM